jgi:hypothetical protein
MMGCPFRVEAGDQRLRSDIRRDHAVQAYGAVSAVTELREGALVDLLAYGAVMDPCRG